MWHRQIKKLKIEYQTISSAAREDLRVLAAFALDFESCQDTHD